MGTKPTRSATIKVIVIRQPWAWLIVNGYKDIENRSWHTRYRGKLLIQASANLPSKSEMEGSCEYARKRGAKLPKEFETGGIVGVTTASRRAGASGSGATSAGFYRSRKSCRLFA